MDSRLLVTDRVRVELERAIPADDAARAMLSAISAWGARAPATEVELATFLDKPVRAALERLYPRERAAEIVEALRAGLAAAELLGPDRPTPVHELDTRITGRIPLARLRPVPVLVVARTEALAHRLQVIAQSDRATIGAHGLLPAIERVVAAVPLVVVLDAVDRSELPADVVVSALGRTPHHVQWIVWGHGRAYGRELSMLAELTGRAIISLREEDGVGPMVDVILSRRA